MAEYIKRSDAIETLMQMCWHDGDGYPVEDADEKRQYAEDWVNAIPSADVVEVKTADWIPYGKEIEIYCWYGKCSNCGEDIFPDDYCPCCGSKLNIPEDIAHAPTSIEEEGT